MSQYDYIKDIAKYGLENDQERLLSVINKLIEHSKKTRKVNFAIQLQSILKEAINDQQTSGLSKVGSKKYYQRIDDREVGELILEKLTSNYSFDNLVCDTKIRSQLDYFIKEHRAADLLNHYNLPVSNRILLHGPSGCGKTLASYVIAGELEKMMVVVNLGAIVSSKLGETSKNLAKLFRKVSSEKSIIFMDEFDSLGKVRDYSQDHGEMKRVVNTILQLFDYLPKDSIVIAATNQKDMVDEALLRRFDLSIEFPLPDQDKIKELVRLTLKKGNFQFDSPKSLNRVILSATGLSYYSIQKTLITSIKKSLFKQIGRQAEVDIKPNKVTISTDTWEELISDEKAALQK